MKRMHRGITGVTFVLLGVVFLIVVTIVGLVIDKQRMEAAKKEDAALKAAIASRIVPTNTPMPTFKRTPLPTIRVASPSAVVTRIVAVGTASATIAPTIKAATTSLQPTSAPTVKPLATPTVAP